MRPTQVSEVFEGSVRTYLIDPAEYGLSPAKESDLSGGTPEDNAIIIENILKGQKDARRDIVLLNAAAALIVAGKAEDVKEGLVLAAQSIDQGAALAKLEAMREFSRRCRGESA